MSLREEIVRLTKQLRKNPAAPAPAFRFATVAQLHRSKMQQRAYDQARLNLKLVTPEQLQRTNAAVHVEPSAHRVIRYTQYVRIFPANLAASPHEQVRNFAIKQLPRLAAHTGQSTRS